jgi:hypothetical protein
MGQSVGSRYRLAVSDDATEGDMGDILAEGSCRTSERRGLLL